MFRIIFIDDYFFLAFLALIGSNGLHYYIITPLYDDTKLSTGLETPSRQVLESSQQQAATGSRIAYAAQFLAWTTIFSVKFSFLLYFRTLIKRLHTLIVLWWFVLIFCIPVACIAVCVPFIECPYMGNSIMGTFHSLSVKSGGTKCSLEKCFTEKVQSRENILLYWSAAADIVTDILSKPTRLYMNTPIH